MFTKGAKKTLSSSDDWTDAKAAWIAACCAAGLAFLTIVLVLPLLKWKADKKFRMDEEKAAGGADEEAAKAKAKAEDEAASETNSKFLKAMTSLKRAAMHGLEVDVHEVVEEGEFAAGLHVLAAHVFRGIAVRL